MVKPDGLLSVCIDYILLYFPLRGVTSNIFVVLRCIF